MDEVEVAMAGLLAELDLGPARGGKRREEEPLICEVVRGLTSEDLGDLMNPPPVEAPAQRIKRVHHQHHQLARLLAQGIADVEASFMTGYSQSYISTIKNHDPAFRELMAYYASEREAIFVETVERMKGLGLRTLDELQARLEEDPERWSNRELMELADLTLVRPMKVGSGQFGGQGGAGAGGGAGVVVNVKFVQPGEVPATRPMVVDAEVIDLKEE